MINHLGQYIVVEGLEGAGKTTAIKTIKRFFTEQKISFITTREPGATSVGESIRNILKDESIKESLDPRTELLLFYAARVELITHIIKPALARGEYVISDRFELSSFAYQGGGRKISADILNSLSDFCVGDVRPDLIIFLDISPEVGLERARLRGNLDRIEQESQEFFTNVYNAYHHYLKRYNNVVKIDASLPLSVVQRIIKEKLHDTFIATA